VAKYRSGLIVEMCMSKTLRLILVALIGVTFASCLIPVPVPGWDGGGHHNHHGYR